MRRLFALGLSTVVACSSFGTTSAEAPDAGASAVPEAGADADATATADGGAGDGFLIPLGNNGCAGVASVPALHFCDDFEKSSDPTAGWSPGINEGQFTLGSDPSAPSPSHFAKATLDDEDVPSGGCAYDRVYNDVSGISYKHLTFQYAIKVGAIDAPTAAQLDQTSILVFGGGGSAPGEVIYVGFTDDQLVVHEQWIPGGGVSHDIDRSFSGIVDRTSWVYLRQTLDLEAGTFELMVEGLPGALSFPLGQSPLPVTATNLTFGVGITCSARGGDMGFDDVVVTYE